MAARWNDFQRAAEVTFSDVNLLCFCHLIHVPFTLPNMAQKNHFHIIQILQIEKKTQSKSANSRGCHQAMAVYSLFCTPRKMFAASSIMVAKRRPRRHFQGPRMKGMAWSSPIHKHIMPVNGLVKHNKRRPEMHRRVALHQILTLKAYIASHGG
jgi:hypothetical protein